METITFTWKLFWDVLLCLIGLGCIIGGFITFSKEVKIKKTGIKTAAKVIDFSYEESLGESRSTLKIPIFEFYDRANNRIVIKGKSNSICKLNEITPIYYDPTNPTTHYYLSSKDFLVKFVFFIIGLFFLSLGVYYLSKYITISY